jgi:hypothetical protein
MTKYEIERLEYALQNPWVFKYNFGHIELVRKFYWASKWPTLEGRLNNQLGDREEAIKQLKETMLITPLAEKYLNK